MNDPLVSCLNKKKCALLLSKRNRQHFIFNILIFAFRFKLFPSSILEYIILKKEQQWKYLTMKCRRQF